MSSTLKYRFATMESGKSAEITSIRRNYDGCGFDGLTLIPEGDVASQGRVWSRNGCSVDAIPFEQTENLFEYTKNELEKGRNLKYVIIDEAQFLTEEQVWQLTDIVDYLDINVLAYGLLTDSFLDYFPGSDLLVRLADHRQELTVHRMCPVCGKKAIINARIVNGELIKEGEQLAIKNQDANIKYIPLCRKCYKKGKWKRD